MFAKKRVVKSLRQLYLGEKSDTLVFDFIDTLDRAADVLRPWMRDGHLRLRPFSDVVDFALHNGVYRTLVFICERPHTEWFQLALIHRKPELTLEALIVRRAKEFESKCQEDEDWDTLQSVISTAKMRLALFQLTPHDTHMYLTEDDYI